MAATTPVSGFADESVASVTSPSEEVGNPCAVAAFSVAAMTVAASGPILAIAITAAAPEIPYALHGLGETTGREGY